MSHFTEYTQYDGLGQAELVEAAISRIERHNPRLNAVIHTMYDEARQAAEARQSAIETPPGF